MTFLNVLENKAEDMASFGGGFILSLLTWVHMAPELIIGKLLMTFAVGVIGGIGGITAKAICNYTTKKYKEWRSKKKLQRLQK